MLKKLFPRNDNFFVLFEKHAACIVQAAKGLLAFTVPGHDPNEVFQKIKYSELEGDRITQECIEALHKTFITPFDRADIHNLISKMNDVLDEIEDVGRHMVIYKLDHLKQESERMAYLVLHSAQEVELAVKELRKIKNTEAMKGHFSNINNIENEADSLLIHGLGRLFEEVKETRTLIKWKEIYERLEKVTDICEDVADILHGIVIEYE